MSIAVFGSVARGSARLGSDVDVIVVADWGPGGMFDRWDRFLPVLDAVDPERTRLLAQGYRADLSPVLWTPEQLQASSFLHFDLATDAVILYDPTAAFALRMERGRRRMAELGSRRLTRDGAFYWDVKPDFKVNEVFDL